jgi:hypothetical protein
MAATEPRRRRTLVAGCRGVDPRWETLEDSSVAGPQPAGRVSPPTKAVCLLRPSPVFVLSSKGERGRVARLQAPASLSCWPDCQRTYCRDRTGRDDRVKTNKKPRAFGRGVLFVVGC